MTKNNQTPKSELSYYGLSLLSFLKDSHPDRVNDRAFISERADRAAEVYSETIQSGLTHIEAEERASAELYRGLHFSPYNTIINILWEEFSDEIPEDNARDVALRLLPLCSEVLAKYSESREINQAGLDLSEAHPVFYKYTLTDDFADTLQHDMLYTELTGTIQILLEDGLQ